VPPPAAECTVPLVVFHGHGEHAPTPTDRDDRAQGPPDAASERRRSTTWHRHPPVGRGRCRARRGRRRPGVGRSRLGRPARPRWRPWCPRRRSCRDGWRGGRRRAGTDRRVGPPDGCWST